MIKYIGIRLPDTGRHAVFKGDGPLDPGPSQKLWNHSPDGFSWGYAGSGPAQLALALLFDATGKERVSILLHQVFKSEYVAKWGDYWDITDDGIRRWAYKQTKRLKKEGRL